MRAWNSLSNGNVYINNTPFYITARFLKMARHAEKTISTLQSILENKDLFEVPRLLSPIRSPKRPITFQEEDDVKRKRLNVIKELKKKKEKLESEMNSEIARSVPFHLKEPEPPSKDHQKTARRLSSSKSMQDRKNETANLISLKNGDQTWHHISYATLFDRCPNIFNFCIQNYREPGIYMVNEKFHLPQAKEGFEGIMTLIVQGREAFRRWLNSGRKALQVVQIACLLQVRNFDQVISDGVNFDFFGVWNPREGPNNFVKMVEICEFFSWYLPLLRYNLCDWLIFHFDYQYTVVKHVHRGEAYSVSWLGRLPPSFVRELASRPTRQFGTENIIFQLLLEWAYQRFSVRAGGEKSSNLFPTKEVIIKPIFSSNIGYYNSWKVCHEKLGNTENKERLQEPFIRFVTSTLDAEFRYVTSPQLGSRITNSILTIENGMVTEYHPFLQRGRILSSNLARENTWRMRCAVDVKDGIVYGMSLSCNKLFRLNLNNVAHSQSGNCKWKEVCSNPVVSKSKFSTVDGMLFNPEKNHLYMFFSCLLDENKPRPFLVVFDCKIREAINTINLQKEDVVCDWQPDVFYFDERHKRVFIGGASRNDNQTLFYSIQVENIDDCPKNSKSAMNMWKLPVITGNLTKGTIILHPKTQHLFYVGGKYDDTSCLPISKHELAYYELVNNKWKRFEVQFDVNDFEIENVLTPLCSFPKPYNFIRIYACEFPSEKRFEGKTMDWPIGENECTKRATINKYVPSQNENCEIWNPLEFRKHQDIPISFSSFNSSTDSSTRVIDGSLTPVRDEVSTSPSFRVHILMPVKSMARYWHSCRHRFDSGPGTCNMHCIVCESLKATHK